MPFVLTCHVCIARRNLSVLDYAKLPHYMPERELALVLCSPRLQEANLQVCLPQSGRATAA